ncbi:MAG: Na+/H+ antiporter NhaA [bacterium]|nr:Na+/H+ antiporter NhaA [bacterium]
MTRTPRPPRPSLAGRKAYRRIPARPPAVRSHSIADRLRDETFAGIVLLTAVVIAMVWANSPWQESYHAISDTLLGPRSLGFELPIHKWAADGVLAIFFFVVGLELKSEFVTGALRSVKAALLPMLAAVCGMVVPALVYTTVQMIGNGQVQGWAIPTATDIAFALALLGLLGKGMPPGVRVFLMTLAVIDDLLAIIVIAIFYSTDLDLVLLAGSFAVIAIFGLLVQRRITAWWILIPLGVLAWALMFKSGVHATIAGVALGMMVPARTRQGEGESLTHRFVHSIQPLSNGFVLPVFAFFAAGVTITGGFGMIADPVAIGVILGLVVGKVLGIWGGVALMTRFTPLRLTGGVDLVDILATSFLAGIGFTVSLLIATLSFGGTDWDGTAKLAVVAGSVISALLAAVALRLRVATRVRGAAEIR